MWIYCFFIIVMCVRCTTASEADDEPILYYYGLEESERTLAICEERQACSAFIQRDWQPPALVRLCACARRQRCDTPAHASDNNTIIRINNRDYLQFCQPVTNWPICTFNETLTVESPYERMNPEELEEMHHKRVQLMPPKLKFRCQCREPNYWKDKTLNESDTLRLFKCGSMPQCRTDEFCGNVNYDFKTLYQSCLCPRNHICVHNGGVSYIGINELLYRGRGWRAYCQRIRDDTEDEYYYGY